MARSVRWGELGPEAALDQARARASLRVIASFQIAKGGERLHVMCVGERSGLGIQPRTYNDSAVYKTSASRYLGTREKSVINSYFFVSSANSRDPAQRERERKRERERLGIQPRTFRVPSPARCQLR
jgi:hypothetical protein